MDCEPAPTSTDGATSVLLQGDLVSRGEPVAQHSPSLAEPAENNQIEPNTTNQPSEVAIPCSDTLAVEQAINTKSIVPLSMWDDGYSALQTKELKLVEAYGRLLSRELLPSSTPPWSNILHHTDSDNVIHTLDPSTRRDRLHQGAIRYRERMNKKRVKYLLPENDFYDTAYRGYMGLSAMESRMRWKMDMALMNKAAPDTELIQWAYDHVVGDYGLESSAATAWAGISSPFRSSTLPTPLSDPVPALSLRRRYMQFLSDP